jgi:hypothetical protein
MIFFNSLYKDALLVEFTASAKEEPSFLMIAYLQAGGLKLRLEYEHEKSVMSVFPESKSTACVDKRVPWYS